MSKFGAFSGCALLLVIPGVAGAIYMLNNPEKMVQTPKQRREAYLENPGPEQRKPEKTPDISEIKVWQEEFSHVLNRLMGEAFLGLKIDNLSAKIFVGPAWSLLTKNEKQILAESFWKSWAAIRGPENVDNAKIKIIDWDGEEVASSGIFGSSISLSDE